jgi:hypothetical protein
MSIELVNLKAGMNPHELARHGKYVVLHADAQYLFALFYVPNDPYHKFPVMQYFAVTEWAGKGSPVADPDFYWNGVGYTTDSCNFAGVWDEGKEPIIDDVLGFAKDWETGGSDI